MNHGSELPDIGKASDANRNVSVVNIEDLEQLARQLLSPQRMAFAGPAGDGWTHRENKRAFNDYPILPGRMRGVDKNEIDTTTKLLGTKLPFPILTAPMGAQGFFHTEADIASAKGTHMAKTLFVASGASTKSMEEIASASAGPKWFQIYLNKDMGLNKELCKRAKAAGYTAIVVTVDSGGPGRSDEYMRLELPEPAAYYAAGNYDPQRGGRGKLSDHKAPELSDIEFVGNACGLPVVVKSLLRKGDIKRAIGHGASAIWVSNHGGRQLDRVASSISRLAPAVHAVKERVPLIVDGGITRGVDVFTALALGASAVAIGRPVLWGMTVGGAAGVNGVYAFLERELRAAMHLSGVRKISKIKSKFVIRP